MGSYPGGKAGAGIYQRIINQFPPHDTYTEAFAGHAAVLRHKKPAGSNVAIDVDSICLQELASLNPAPPSGTEYICGCAVAILSASGRAWSKRDLIYLDPPYPFESRAGAGRQIYRHEFGTIEQHHELLRILSSLPATIAISSYPNTLYDQALQGWRKIEYRANTRGNNAQIEVLWLNYPEPVELHEYTYLGDNKRQREVLRRRIRRWQLRLARMTPLDRLAMVAAISDYRGSRQK
jgi:DNA adenine methylase